MFDQFIDHMNIYIFQLPFWLKIQFVITHFRFPTQPTLGDLTQWWGVEKLNLDCFHILFRKGSQGADVFRLYTHGSKGASLVS